MKIVLLAFNGGSGGQKGYIKGFISACGQRPDCEWFVICHHTFAEYIQEVCDTNNVTMIVNDCTMGVKSIVLGNRLPRDVIQIIDEIKPDAVFYMNSIIHKGTESYKNILGLHNQLYIDKRQLRRQKLGKTRLSLTVLRPFVMKSLKKADLVVFDSNNSMENTKAIGIEPRKNVVAYYGVEDPERKLIWEDKRLSDPVNILYVSTLYPYKNQVELIHGIYKLVHMGYNVHLHLVGSGPKQYVEKVKQTILRNNMLDNVTIHNWVEHSKVKDMIAMCDVFVYASSIETSGFGLMEGMVQGAVIACNQESCMPEVLNGGGELFDVFSPEDIADKLKKLLDDPSLRRNYSRRAFEVSKVYRWENCIRVISEAIMKIIES